MAGPYEGGLHSTPVERVHDFPVNNQKHPFMPVFCCELLRVDLPPSTQQFQLQVMHIIRAIKSNVGGDTANYLRPSKSRCVVIGVKLPMP